MQMEKIFDMVGCTEVQKVYFASFKLKGEAEQWWRSTKKTLPLAEDEILTWTIFLEAFYEKYFPKSVRDGKKMEFMELIQGNKTVLQYEAKFTELARFAPHVVSDDVRKAKNFQRVLRPSIRTKIYDYYKYKNKNKKHHYILYTDKVIKHSAREMNRI